MNASAAIAVLTPHGYEGHFRPVWSAVFQKVQENGRTVYFSTAAEAECRAWRVLYAVEQPVMVRDGEIIRSQSQADAAFNLKPFVRERGRERRARV